MNFYKHHIGDYAQATAHLSFAEDAAYSRLLRKYYAEEKPIPADLKTAQRVVAARTREERDAVETVLSEFFTLEVDGWHNKRADEEIAKARALEDERDGRRANEAERQRRHRERRKELFEILREHGQVPKFDTKTEALEAMASRVTGANRTRDTNVTDPDSSRVTGGVRNGLATANQTPDARRQTPDKSSNHTPGSSIAAEATAGVGSPHGLAAAALNRAGLRITSQDPRLLEAVAAGVTPALLLEVHGLYPDKPAGYVVAAARRIHTERANPPTGAPAHAPRSRPSLADQVRDPSRNDGDVLEGKATRVAHR